MIKFDDERKMSRRRFLGSAAAAAAGAALSGSLLMPRLARADQLLAPSNRITLGCIGVGGMGTANMNVFLQHPQCQVVAVCDVDKNHLAVAKSAVEKFYSDQAGKTYKGCSTYGDFRELLARPDIDAVVIATPDHWHTIIATSAAKIGKDVYCEKPLSLTLAEGRTTADIMKRYGRVFQTGSWQRSVGTFHFAAELVRNQRIGQLQEIHVGLPDGPAIEHQAFQPVPPELDYNMWLGPAPWAPYTAMGVHFHFRWHYDYSGGMVTDWGVHHCDIAQWAMGVDDSGPTEIEGKAEFPSPDYFSDTATNFRFVCTYPSGVKMIVSNKYENGIKFIGSDGWIFVSRERIDASPRSLLTTVIAPSETHLYKSDDHQGNFLDCVRSRKVTITPAEVAHRSASICHLGNTAMRLQKKIQWDPLTERFINDPEAERMISRSMRGPWQL